MCQMLAEYLNKTEEALFKTYISMLIYYTLKTRLCAIFFLALSHSLLSLFRSPALSHVGGSTGHTAMPHQYAKW